MNASLLSQIQVSDALLLAVLSVASVTDVRARRIPNRLVLAGFGLGLAMAILDRGFSGVAYALSGAGLGIVLMLPFFALGWLGAGDVKLLGAAGAYAGASGVAMVAGLSALAGGALAALVIARFGRAGGQARLPYALAIFCGSVGWMVLR